MSTRENLPSPQSSEPATPALQNREEFVTPFSVGPTPVNLVHPSEHSHQMQPRRLNFDSFEPLAAEYVVGRDVAKPFKKTTSLKVNFKYEILELKRIIAYFGQRIRAVCHDFLYDLPEKYVNEFAWTNFDMVDYTNVYFIYKGRGGTSANR